MIFNSKNKIQRRTLETETASGKGVHFSRFLFYLLGLVFLGVSVYAFFFSPFLQIKKIRLSGLEDLEYEKIMADVESVVEGKYGKLISKNNLLLVRSQEIQSKLLDNHKKIRSVEITKVFPDTLFVSVEERKALLVWCSGSDCFVVDESGSAYAPADFDSSEVKENKLIVIRDRSQSPVFPNQEIVGHELVDFIIEFQNEIETRLDIELEREFETPKSISGDISARTREGWEIRLNQSLGAVKEAEMLQITLEQNIGHGKRKDLEYIDLRTQDKVYYKLKNSDSRET